MDGGTTGGELIELERNSESEDGQAPIQIQELTLDIYTEGLAPCPQESP